MSPADPSMLARGRIGFTTTSGSTEVKWIRPDAAHLPYPMAKPTAQHSERARALIVIALTLACTLLAVYDLFLLAAGA